MTTLQIAAFPFDVRPGEVAHNLNLVLEALEQAAHGGARLMVLPEQWTTSFLPSYSEAMRRESEDALADVHRQAAGRNLVVVGSAPGGQGGKPFNELHVLGAAGSHRPYRKRMLFSPSGEGRQVARGKQLPTIVDTPFGKLLGVICYDLRFPEISRVALHQQADFLVCPAQWPWPRVPIFDLMTRARAAENQLWTVACNRAGEAALDGKQPMRFPGSALLVNPLGDIVARTDDGSLLLAPVDLEQAAKVRRTVPLARDLQKAGLWPEDGSEPTAP